MMIEYIKKKKN